MNNDTKQTSVNLTKTRLAALRLIQQRPDMRFQDLCGHLWEGGHITWRRPVGPEPQAAARWSGGFIAPLIKAGIISRTVDGKINLTPKGREALQNG